MKNYIKQFTMKRDLYRFAKARKNKRKEIYRLSAEEIKMIEYQYYFKYNNSIHNTIKV